MERFFILNDINTYYDWGLILTAKDVSPPDPKTYNVAIDGMHGSLDLSESLTGEVTYNNRTVSASFLTDEGTFTDRENLMLSIISTIHGRKIRIVEPDDPNHYFFGRVKIKSRKNTAAYLEFSIEAECEPWRYAEENTVRHIHVQSATVTNVVIHNDGRKTVCPLVEVAGSVTLAFGGVSVSLTDGSYKISDIKLYQGANTIGVSGNGAVSITYREAAL